MFITTFKLILRDTYAYVLQICRRNKLFSEKPNKRNREFLDKFIFVFINYSKVEYFTITVIIFLITVIIFLYIIKQNILISENLKFIYVNIYMFNS